MKDEGTIDRLVRAITPLAILSAAIIVLVGGWCW